MLTYTQWQRIVDLLFVSILLTADEDETMRLCECCNIAIRMRNGGN
jgi:hypothetical protein